MKLLIPLLFLVYLSNGMAMKLPWICANCLPVHFDSTGPNPRPLAKSGSSIRNSGSSKKHGSVSGSDPILRGSSGSGNQSRRLNQLFKEPEVVQPSNHVQQENLSKSNSKAWNEWATSPLVNINNNVDNELPKTVEPQEEVKRINSDEAWFKLLENIDTDV